MLPYKVLIGRAVYSEVDTLPQEPVDALPPVSLAYEFLKKTSAIDNSRSMKPAMVSEKSMESAAISGEIANSHEVYEGA